VARLAVRSAMGLHYTAALGKHGFDVMNATRKERMRSRDEIRRNERTVNAGEADDAQLRFIGEIPTARARPGCVPAAGQLRWPRVPPGGRADLASCAQLLGASSESGIVGKLGKAGA
jgi:hypothetical protein